MNIYDKAYELSNAIKQLPEYISFKNAYRILNANEQNKKMLEDFRKKQLELQAKEISGEKVSEQEKETLQKLWEVLNLNPELREYLSSEYNISKILDDIMKIIMEAVEIDD
ncbi:MAG: YlbF family regulator [Thermoanaerobacteraceae bacterium]